ncbi:stage V sporulation protein AB [Bacillus changyiensis]|uniref:stage V sporulation protein AB n=1 Tax=Bacillus changyiensis TaxID=3004103 RepID=UPI0022E5591C|nr:stage V sporulation protein AB [Bacillus changyiensis]MDA1474999.1 stage V sporulation protein AB [Bacillus changyiensis]
MTIKLLFISFLGLAGGVAVGSGFVAFLTVLGVIPRLIQLTKTKTYIRAYEWAVILGAVFGGWETLNTDRFFLSKWLLIPIGLFSGVFIGMLAAALTEVLNVLPILAKRIGLADRVLILLMAIVLGKIIGSLFQWFIFVHIS